MWKPTSSCKGNGPGRRLKLLAESPACWNSLSASAPNVESFIERARAELMDATPDAQFRAVPGASLRCVAEVVRNPVERGVPAARVAQIAAGQIAALLNRSTPSDGG